MKSRSGNVEAGKDRQNGISLGTLGRKTVAVRRQQRMEAITAAMEESRRSGAFQTVPQDSAAALGRAVEAAQRSRKKHTVTTALEESQRGAQQRSGHSELLEREVVERKRLHKKEAITTSMKDSQRRTAPRES